MNRDTLVRMANQIGTFFQSQPDHNEALEGLASASVRIVQPGGEESLNVAAAAAICLHASAAAR